MSETTEPAADQSLAEIDRALFSLMRKLNPRVLARLAEEAGVPPPANLDDAPVLHVISGGCNTDGAGGCGEVTVGAVAENLCVDPSRASRMVSSAIADGHVTRLASQADGRRSVLALTPAGQAVIAEADQFRWAAYQGIMRDWPAADRAEFARLLRAFVDRL